MLLIVEGFIGRGVVGCLMVIHAIRGWTLAIIGVEGVARCRWLLCWANVQVVQKADKKLLLIVLELLLVETVLPHGFVHGRDHGRHLGDDGG